MSLYEGMFVLDNELVRSGWPEAKAVVAGLIQKHGGEVETSRRWAERKLAYPMNGRTRATYLLTYYRIERDGIAGLIRDLDLSEQILRYLLLRVDEVPAGEAELAASEETAEFELPAVPEDSFGKYDPLQKPESETEGEGSEGEAAEAESKPEAPAAEASSDAAPADAEPVAVAAGESTPSEGDAPAADATTSDEEKA